MIGDPKYVLKTDLDNYMQTTTIWGTFVSKLNAENTYATKTMLEGYMSAKTARETFVYKNYADNTYAPKSALEGYISRSWAVSTFALKNSLNDYLTVQSYKAQAAKLKKYLKDNNINTTSDDLAGLIIDALKGVK